MGDFGFTRQPSFYAGISRAFLPLRFLHVHREQGIEAADIVVDGFWKYETHTRRVSDRLTALMFGNAEQVRMPGQANQYLLYWQTVFREDRTWGRKTTVCT